MDLIPEFAVLAPRSLGSIQSLLKEDEQYIWHAPLFMSGPHNASVIVPLLIVFALLMMFGQGAGVATYALGAVMLISLCYMIGEYMIVPYEMLVVTNRRLLHVTRKMRIMSTFDYEHLSVEERAGGTVVVRGSRDDTSIKWMCLANEKHAQHLLRQLDRNDSDTNLLSS